MLRVLWWAHGPHAGAGHGWGLLRPPSGVLFSSCWCLFILLNKMSWREPKENCYKNRPLLSLSRLAGQSTIKLVLGQMPLYTWMGTLPDD